VPNILAQQDSIPKIVRDSLHFKGNLQVDNSINNLAPAKAAFYSAVLPGLGQAYNKQYWKLPIVYGAMGAGVYFYISNGNEYNRYRTAYFDRKNGLPDEFPQYTSDVLIKAQEIYKQQRDTALMLTILAYFLNIIDANVSAHLKQWNVSDDLSISPVQFNTPKQRAFGLQMRFNLTN
jgi:hypothetical protein